MVDKIRIGFIGAGRHASNILYPSLRYTPFELVAVAALEEDEAQRAAKNFGAERYYVGGFEEMLAKEQLDACLVAVPPPAYRDILCAVLERGLPVWCEKPAGGSVADIAAVEETARRTGKPVQVGYMKRFAPAYRMAKQAMAKEAFGAPSAFVGKFVVGPGLYPDEYTYVVDNPIHLLDLARFFMGDIERVSVEKKDWGERRWSYAVLLRFASGAVGTLHLANTQSWRQPNEFVEITGQGHFISVDNVVRYRYNPPDGAGEYWEPNPTVPSAQNASVMLTGYAYELIHFADVVRDGILPQVTIADARRALELADEVYRQGGGALEPGKRASAW
ncbi:MAG: Gfo/Idh/MocA family oxidoreductase [Chloroflexi bacterium]|nr:Gfo/Idh/MocA family oxidoreductase [Chloroflexota bacterium]